MEVESKSVIAAGIWPTRRTLLLKTHFRSHDKEYGTFVDRIGTDEVERVRVRFHMEEFGGGGEEESDADSRIVLPTHLFNQAENEEALLDWVFERIGKTEKDTDAGSRAILVLTNREADRINAKMLARLPDDGMEVPRGRNG